MVVLLLSAGYLVAKGGIAVKQKLETRKHPTRDGDFIELPLSWHDQQSKRRNKRSSLTQSLHEQWARLSGRQLQPPQEQQQQQQAPTTVSYYQCGQEVVLQNMQDALFNGRKAEVIFDTGSRGVLVRLEGDDFDMGTLLLPENLQPVPDASSSTTTATPDDADRNISVGMLVELHNLQSPAHCDKNGRRCRVVHLGNVHHDAAPKFCSGHNSPERITVKLVNDNDKSSNGTTTTTNHTDSDVLFRVKPINCKLVRG